ncbi:MAG TPA: cobyric acid synthase CobQ, partial [Burkholderiaceae bacterium]|nr:cobyric acid synthase CobQ [Burkholderiaceae bacterium]
GKLIGICGGFQMLGRSVADPHGVEGMVGVAEALGLLDMHTELKQEKRLTRVSGRCAFADAAVGGYEIHMGESHSVNAGIPAFYIDDIDEKPEGLRSVDDQVLGTYLHGIFDHPEACSALLRWAGLGNAVSVDVAQLREQSLDRIADAALPLYQALQKIENSENHSKDAP